MSWITSLMSMTFSEINKDPRPEGVVLKAPWKGEYNAALNFNVYLPLKPAISVFIHRARLLVTFFESAHACILSLVVGTTLRRMPWADSYGIAFFSNPAQRTGHLRFSQCLGIQLFQESITLPTARMTLDLNSSAIWSRGIHISDRPHASGMNDRLWILNWRIKWKVVTVFCF